LANFIESIIEVTIDHLPDKVAEHDIFLFLGLKKENIPFWSFGGGSR